MTKFIWRICFNGATARIMDILSRHVLVLQSRCSACTICEKQGEHAHYGTEMVPTMGKAILILVHYLECRIMKCVFCHFTIY